MNTETMIVLRSATHSIKAKKLLSASGIRSRTVKPPPDGDKGCAYGIAVALPLANKAMSILRESNIPIIKTVN